MSLTGEQFESLAMAVKAYNQALVAEKDASRVKDAAAKECSDIMKEAKEREVVVAAGNTVKFLPWSPLSVNVNQLSSELPEAYQAIVARGLVKESSGLRVDIRPLRV